MRALAAAIRAAGAAAFFSASFWSGVALCDVNGDGKLDAVTVNYRERSISVLLGVGDGTFKPAVTTPIGLRLQNGQWVADDK
jgi:hypothetical protein